MLTVHQEDALVVAVDWSGGCRLPFYAQAAVNTQLVGREVAVVLYKLLQSSPENVSPGTTHFIGHSLGAQMGMFFSDYFKTLSGGLLVGRITGESLESNEEGIRWRGGRRLNKLISSALDDTGLASY